ncbi:MAG: hypothetical protein LUD02_09070 [Tannerellaceae bacterium]|nr:hypothetical protein [Tannerellaceae bacterium]
MNTIQSMFNYQQIANQNISLEKEARRKDFYKFLLISSGVFFLLSAVIGILLAINVHNKKEMKLKKRKENIKRARRE